MSPKNLLFLLVTVGLCVAPFAHAQTLQVVGDSFANTAYPSVSSGSSVYLSAGGSSSTYLQFDLSSLPSGTNVANITKVNLILFVGPDWHRRNPPGRRGRRAMDRIGLRFYQCPRRGNRSYHHPCHPG